MYTGTLFSLPTKWPRLAGSILLLLSFSVHAQKVIPGKPISSAAATKDITEERFIHINGIEQWVTIKGDRSKPVVLFLHGGPGSTMSPYADTIYGYWKKHFVVVNWDQRGAGRTFGRNAPAEVTEDFWIENPLTIKQMTADGIELSQYLLQYLGKKKIIIIGTSWGSILGARMALSRPDLFDAYIGHSQVVNASQGFIQAYNKVMELANQSGNKEEVSKLKSIGTPPYDDAKVLGQLLRIIKKYESDRSVQAPAYWWKLASAYDNEDDARHRYNGDDYSFINFAGHKKMGIKAMWEGVNFMSDGLSYQIPVYIIQGQEDILTPKELTRTYFDSLKAPKKEYILLPGAAHGHNQSVIKAQYTIAQRIAGGK